MDVGVRSHRTGLPFVRQSVAAVLLSVAVEACTHAGQAFARGSPYPGEIFGSSSYPPDTPAAQCLVPAGKNNYNVEVIVLSDGTVLLAGTQPVGNTFMTRA